MEAEIKGFKGFIREMTANVVTKSSFDKPRIVSYDVTLFIPDEDITIDFKQAYPSEIKILNNEEENYGK